MDIDPVVALGDAWQTGAFARDVPKRTSLANDPVNLLAVDYSANRQKGDGDAATWLPGNKGYRCAYVARQVAVKASYGLWVTPAEHDAMDRVLSACPDEPLPTATAATPTQTSEPVPASAPASGPSYPDCAAARARVQPRCTAGTLATRARWTAMGTAPPVSSRAFAGSGDCDVRGGGGPHGGQDGDQRVDVGLGEQRLRALRCQAGEGDT